MTAELQIRPLSGMQEMLQVEQLQRQVWAGSETDIVPAHLLLTLAHNGGLLLGALLDERLVGFVLGFLGTDQESPNRVAMARLKHCSHMLGVLPECRQLGIGFRLKVAQREAVISQGIRLVTWTYDPLMSANAHLNIRRLGAVSGTYHRDLYGDMRDELNLGLPSDRFEVEWWVTSSRVSSRLEESRPPLDLANYLAAGAQKLNLPSLNQRGLPQPGDTALQPEGMLALIEIPPDFNAIKDADPELAMAWRMHTRQIFEQSFAAGYLVTDFIYFKGEQLPRSYYVISLGEATLG